METETMGRVLTEATIENLEDLWAVKRGLTTPEQARRIIVADALVDTGATLLSLPTSLIRQLGLNPTSSKRVTSSNGLAEAAVYEADYRDASSASQRSYARTSSISTVDSRSLVAAMRPPSLR
jgi:hypothetical protein